jgi:eukaryotic-like serine/threonine-protein kinase
MPGRSLHPALAGRLIDDLDPSSSLSLALRALAAAPPVPLEVLAPPLAAGTRMDEFELQGVIGKGGMSVVYRARDTLLGRDVAIKVLNPAWSETVEPDAMFEREARATARLRHPGIVTIHRVGRHSGRLYLVLELLEGETLAARLQRGPLDEDEAVSIALQLLGALGHAHAHGIVHRDIKPSNVFIETSGNVVMLDFGLSRAAAQGTDLGGTSRGLSLAGTPAYMAPELWRGHRADARTDVFAAGVVLFELITSMRDRSPSPRQSRLRTGRQRRQIRSWMTAVVSRATAPDREERFSDAAAMAEALAALLSSAAGRRCPWRLLAGAVAAIIAASAIAIGAHLFGGDAPGALPRTSRQRRAADRARVPCDDPRGESSRHIALRSALSVERRGLAQRRRGIR